jgi:hypothetical protein
MKRKNSYTIKSSLVGSNEKAEMMERMKKHLENTRESFISNLKAAEELNFQGGVMAGPTQSDRLHH